MVHPLTVLCRVCTIVYELYYYYYYCLTDVYISIIVLFDSGRFDRNKVKRSFKNRSFYYNVIVLTNKVFDGLLHEVTYLTREPNGRTVLLSVLVRLIRE